MSLEYATRVLDILLEIKVRDSIRILYQYCAKFIETDFSRILVGPFPSIVEEQVLAAVKYEPPPFSLLASLPT